MNCITSAQFTVYYGTSIDSVHFIDFSETISNTFTQFLRYLCLFISMAFRRHSRQAIKMFLTF